MSMVGEAARVVPSDYGPRYSPASAYAPHVPRAWGDPADEGDGITLWTPPGCADPIWPTVATNTDAREEAA